MRDAYGFETFGLVVRRETMNPINDGPTEVSAVDTPDRGVATERPTQISTAVALIWVSLALGVVNSALEWPYLTSRASVSFVLFVQITTLALIVWPRTRHGADAIGHASLF
jgi:hypothetical protein